MAAAYEGTHRQNLGRRRPAGGNDIRVNGRGSFFYGWPEDDPSSRVWVQRVMEHVDEDDRQHVLTAWERAQVDAIRDSPYIRRVLDLAEPFDLYLFHEYAQTSLDEAVRQKVDVDVEAVERNVRLALETLHGAGYVHCDIREDNVLQVDGVWKLADLGGSAVIGEEILWLQRDARYRHPSIEEGTAARPEYDWYSLGVLLDNLAA